MFPKIKDGISVLYRRTGSSYEVNFLLNASGTSVPFLMNEPAFRCLGYLDGEHSIDQVVAATGLEAPEVQRLVSALRRGRFLCTRANAEALPRSQFTTQLHFFAEFETSKLSRQGMQSRMEKARAVIIGLGGVGSWVAQGLVMAGIGGLTLVDDDVVELPNLNRQCLYSLENLGEPKVDVAARKLVEFGSRPRLLGLRQKILNKEDCIAVSRNAHLIINCGDEPETGALNRIVTEAGFELRMPHILCGGYDGHLSFLGPTVIPGKTACWYCYEHALHRQLDIAGYEHLTITPSHVQGGNLAAICAITANYHVLEAMKVLTGFATPSMVGRAAELDFLTFETHFRDFKQRRNCAVCRRLVKGANG